jgi:hypothetical protein
LSKGSEELSTLSNGPTIDTKINKDIWFYIIKNIIFYLPVSVEKDPLS